MFKPARMERVRVIANKKYAETLLSALHDAGVMQIEQLPEDALAILGSGSGSDYKKVAEYAQRFRGLESLLIPCASKRKFSFRGIGDIEAAAARIRIDEKVAAISKALDEIKSNSKDLESRLALLSKIGDFDADLSILNNAQIVSFAVYGPQSNELEQALKGNSSILATKLEACTIFSMSKAGEKEFGAAAEKYKVVVEFIPRLVGKVAAAKRSVSRHLSFALADKRRLESQLMSISEKYYAKVSAIREQLDIDMERADVANRLAGSASVVAVEGWVPSASVEKLDALLKKATEKSYLLERITTTELPPTKMENPIGTRLYEFFIRFYSLPRSDEIDPTIMFAIAFPIFFGFMVGDFGYGLVMLLLAAFIIHRVDHPPKVSRIPKAITSFISLLISRNSLKVLAKSIIPGALIAMALGVAFNEYFGFQLPYTALFNVETGLSHLLVISGWIGVFMVEFGFVLGALNRLALGETKHAVAKIGWAAAGIGFVIFGLNILHRAPLDLSNPIAVISYAMLAGGIAVIVKFEGARGIMELPSLISHMLSYTRLVGILLASVILAEVIDLIFVGSWHHSIILGIIGTIILVIGQLFNITIAMFEPGIQGARLIYVEFFSKFFAGNGRQFKPFAAHREKTEPRFRV